MPYIHRHCATHPPIHPPTHPPTHPDIIICYISSRFFRQPLQRAMVWNSSSFCSFLFNFLSQAFSFSANSFSMLDNFDRRELGWGNQTKQKWGTEWKHNFDYNKNKFQRGSTFSRGVDPLLVVGHIILFPQTDWADSVYSIWLFTLCPHNRTQQMRNTKNRKGQGYK